MNRILLISQFAISIKNSSQHKYQFAISLSYLQYSLQLQTSMESKLSAKRNQFSNEIRKHQINTIMAEYRSKLTNSLQQNYEEMDFLDKVLQHESNRFSKIKTILQTMANNHNSFDNQMENKRNNQQLVTLLSNDKSVKITVKLNDLSLIQIDNKTFLVLLKALAKGICTKIQIVNINFQQSLKINTTEKLIAKINIVDRQVAQLVEIAQICNFLLSILTTIRLQNTQRSLNLLKELTLCLVELSCFRPRHYSSNQQLAITKQVNNKMEEFRHVLNTSIACNLYNIVKQTTGEELNMNIKINILQIFGNIFVSLSSKSTDNIQNFKELHDLCFDLIRKCVLQINPSMQSEQIIYQQSKRSQFSYLASVIVWFIRNEVLIIDGMFMTNRDIIKDNTSQPANEEWILLIVNILQYYGNDFKLHKQLSLTDIKTLCDIASLLKLIKYDFQLKLSSFCDCIKYLQTFLRTQNGMNNMSTLKGHIYELFAQLLTYNPQQITQTANLNPSYMELYNFVYNQAIGLSKDEKEILQQSLQLSSVILSNFCKNKSIKQQFYQEVCSHLEVLLNKLTQKINNLSYEKRKDRIIFVYEFLKQMESHQGSSMQNELLSYNSISSIFLMCTAIWEHIKSTEQDVICSLRLLKLIADNQQYTNLLKQVVIGQGYSEQLQTLQAEKNAQINLLAYEIFELLEIQ